MPGKAAAKSGGQGARGRRGGAAPRRGRAAPARGPASPAHVPATPAGILDLQRSAGNSAVQGLLGGRPVQRCGACGGSCGGGKHGAVQRQAAPPKKDEMPVQRAAEGGGPSDKDKLAMAQQFLGGAPEKEKPVQRQAAPGAKKEEKPVQRQTAPGAKKEEKPVQRQTAPGPMKEEKPVQRQAAPGAMKEEKPVQRQAAPEKEKPVQREAGGGSPAGPISVPAGGRPLPSATRAAMETGFGHDFGGVRVHTDQAAAAAARNAQARAFTTGSDIVFAPGEFNPGTASGRHLLAHELTHVVQQRAGRVPANSIDTPGDSFEREANSAASAVTAGRRPSITGAQPPAVQRQKGGAAATPASAPRKAGSGAYTVPDKPEYALKIPGSKVAGDTPWVRERHEGFAKANALREVHAGRGELWDVWASSRGYANREDFEKAADVTDPDPKEAKKKKAAQKKLSGACSPDHIVELQIGGPDNPANLRLVTRSRNSSAGASVRAARDRVRKAVVDSETDPPKETDILIFKRVDVSEDGGFDDCLSWEKDHGTLQPPAGLKPPKNKEGEDYAQIIVMVAGVAVPISHTGGEVSRDSQYAISGLQLTTIKEAGKGYQIDAVISPKARRVPLKGKPKPYVLDVGAPSGGEDGPRSINFAGGPGLDLTFPFLSETTLPLELSAGSVAAHGVLKPTLPLLREVEVKLDYENEELSGGIQVPPDKLKKALPVPGLEIPEATLGIFYKQGKFEAVGGFSVKYQNIADGRVEARMTATGFSATGEINLHIPGLDEAKGKVWVKEGRFGGQISIGADKLKFPGVKSANLVVTIEDGALNGTGKLQLSIPGVKEAQLGFGMDAAGNFGITGTATLAIPGVKDAKITLAYKDADLQGQGEVALDIPGLEGANVSLRYAQGKVSGSAKVAYKKGKLSGFVTLNLSEQNKLSGGGELAYEIAPGLVAFAGLQIDEEGKTKVSGGLRVPETIDLFGKKEVEKEIFKMPTIEIPILAIPLGTRSAGLVATIDARLIGRASVGPGQLRKVKILAEFDPMSESAGASFQASAELFVPANAELAVSVAGGLGLSIAIARAIGGIEAEGAAGVQADFTAAADLKYEGGQFAVSGKAELGAQPKLAFRLKAFVRVEVDLWVTTIEVYRKDWQLASFEAGSALRVGVRMPFNYVFGKPFEFSADQIEFIKPDFDAMGLVKDLLPG